MADLNFASDEAAERAKELGLLVEGEGAAPTLEEAVGSGKDGALTVHDVETLAKSAVEPEDAEQPEVPEDAEQEEAEASPSEDEAAEERPAQAELDNAAAQLEGATVVTAKNFYAGADPATGEEFQLEAGDSRVVSKEKAEQLQRDFPDDFDFEPK